MCDFVSLSFYIFLPRCLGARGEGKWTMISRLASQDSIQAAFFLLFTVCFDFHIQFQLLKHATVNHLP